MAFPINHFDVFRLKVDVSVHAMEQFHENCYNICTDHTDLPFVSYQEGTCLRNCITKFTLFYPTLKENLQHSDFVYYEDQYDKIKFKKDPRYYKKLLEDPMEIKEPLHQERPSQNQKRV
mmetsp:Transcript_18241/g.17369  ORF Transcript_18241/g.17369 Transcript_18241/m.17369 type:complete len:119 (+) Transcript_18241:149-505(+)